MLQFRGFTFVEIILVVVVLGVLAAVAVPALSGSYRNLLVQNTAQDMAALMRYAQSRAITQDAEILLVFDQRRRSYRLKSLTSSDGSLDANAQDAIPRRWGRTFRVPEELTVEIENQEIGFFPDGRISKARICICREDTCLTVSTREQRGRVLVFNGRLETTETPSPSGERF